MSTAGDTRPRAVYVASPLGFTSYGAGFQREVGMALINAGFAVHDPWSTAEGVELAGLIAENAAVSRIAGANARVGLANERLIDSAAAVLACLDGSDVDSGTAAEIGYAAAVGKPVFAFRIDFRRAGDNAASMVNLQVEHFIRRNGGSLHHSLMGAVEALVAHFY